MGQNVIDQGLRVGWGLRWPFGTFTAQEVKDMSKTYNVSDNCYRHVKDIKIQSGPPGGPERH